MAAYYFCVYMPKNSIIVTISSMIVKVVFSWHSEDKIMDFMN